MKNVDFVILPLKSLKMCVDFGRLDKNNLAIENHTL